MEGNSNIIRDIVSIKTHDVVCVESFTILVITADTEYYPAIIDIIKPRYPPI